MQHAADNEHRKLQEELVQKFLNLRESFMEKETLGLTKKCNTSYATRNFLWAPSSLRQRFLGGYDFHFLFTQVIRKVLRDEYADEFERGQVEVEQIYVKFCLLLVAKIPEHGLDLSRLEEAEATASEAQEKLREAIELNKTREFNLSEWLSEASNC